jgi:hypothetical protein
MQGSNNRLFEPPPLGTILYLPLSRMEIGRSPNLLNNPGFEEGTTGWGEGGAYITQETSIVHSGTKSGKATATSGGYRFAYQSVGNYANYKGITTTLQSWHYVPTSKTANESYVNINDGAGEASTMIGKLDAWQRKLTTRKISTSATQLRIAFVLNQETDVNGQSDYADDFILTIPQSMSKDAYGRICHPEGCIWTPQGFSFDGIDDHISLEDGYPSSPFNLVAGQDMTVMMWVKLNRLASGGDATGMQILNRGMWNEDGWQFWIYNGNEIRLITGQPSSYDDLRAYSSLQPDVWGHIALTVSQGTEVKVYQDGKRLTCNKDSVVAPASSSYPLRLGIHKTLVDYPFDGLMDELVIVNRVLSQLEIARIHDSGSKDSGRG